jgi:hypothetical protein
LFRRCLTLYYATILSTFDQLRIQDKAKAEEKLFGQDDDFKYFKAIYQREQWQEEDNPYADGSGSPRIRRLETQEEMEKRIYDYVSEPTDHSTLLAHLAFMERVAAYDLRIGFCDSASDAVFWKKLQKEADWLSGKDVYYNNGMLEVPLVPSGIEPETVQDQIDNQQRGK